MRDTPPLGPIGERDTESLLEDLCVALRNVGLRDRDLPRGDKVREHVAEVRAIKAELVRRSVKTDDRITRLSHETNWRMQDLLRECLEFPDSMPYVKEADGIRRTLRCRLCRTHERPSDAKVFWWCNECLVHGLKSIEERTPFDGIVLFRTYNPEARCQHADSETILVAEYSSDTIYGCCAKCLTEELTRRTSSWATVS
ncbi:MAG TPA: hypothetical protein VNX28_14040 [Gemmataceae bacterium]|nr:hypothetical protein [Gemmataceae bacterium]